MDTLKYITDKYKINIGKQYFIEVPEIQGGYGLAQLLAELKLNKGAEVGTGLGQYAEVLCHFNPKLHLSCVDAWDINAYPKGMLQHSVETGHSVPGVLKQDFWENWYQQTLKKLKPLNCTIIRKRSMDAVKDFKDESLDFVYLDAGHDFVNFTLDLHYWKDKVRKGGIIAGHDYSRFPTHKMIHVKGVLQTYMPYYHMLPVFTLSRRKHSMRRDYYGNWFYVKK
jgi:hypothetical protein